MDSSDIRGGRGKHPFDTFEHNGKFLELSYGNDNSFSMRGSGCGRQTCAQLFRKEMEIQKIKKGAIKKKPRMICRY